MFGALWVILFLLGLSCLLWCCLLDQEFRGPPSLLSIIETRNSPCHAMTFNMLLFSPLINSRKQLVISLLLLEKYVNTLELCLCRYHSLHHTEKKTNFCHFMPLFDALKGYAITLKIIVNAIRLCYSSCMRQFHV